MKLEIKQIKPFKKYKEYLSIIFNKQRKEKQNLIRKDNSYNFFHFYTQSLLDERECEKQKCNNLTSKTVQNIKLIIFFYFQNIQFLTKKNDSLKIPSKVCNYRKIKGKNQSSNIVLIKTCNLQERSSNSTNRPLKVCKYRYLSVDSYKQEKNIDQIDENLKHYARIVIYPEFGKLFLENSQNKENSNSDQNNITKSFEQKQFLIQNDNNYNVNNSSSSGTTNISTNNGEELNMKLKIQYEDILNKKLGEDENQNHLNRLSNEDTVENINFEGINCKITISLQSKKEERILKKCSQQNEESYQIYEKVNSLLSINQHLFQSLLLNFDFGIFQLAIKPEAEQFFIQSVVNIFQSFTKKYRAPYKMTSKQNKNQRNSIKTQNQSQSLSHSNQSEEQQLMREEDVKKQPEDYANNDLKSESYSSQQEKKVPRVKKGQNNQIRQSKFHNLKKSFMHALILLFQQDILGCLELSQNHAAYLQTIINRMRACSTKTRQGNGQYEYYSHTHYTALLLKLNQYSISLVTQNENDLQLHYTMFLEDLSSSNGADKASIKCNFYKDLIFKIIQMSINIVEKQNNLLPNIDCEKKSVCRFDYILRVKSGIEKLNTGVQVTRF